tara:strand:- start:20249 stop:21763 length:1515 start_codon:yes stop_codon:yes gene_type:complete
MEINIDLIVRNISYVITGIYLFCLLLIFIYSLTQLNMLLYFLRFENRKEKQHLPSKLIIEKLPNITIQLPLYNELYVVERLLDCISKLEYPKEKLQIQVLDDSTDESLDLTKSLVLKLQKNNIPIILITRENRNGFKAGALKNGLKTATGDFIAIFDADFLPKSDWLLKTILYFENPKIGLVQTRWGHLNRSFSILTEIQAFALDAHFLLEQIGRNQQNHFINFNGTAGIWRKECIIDSGNWESDTLTEDLDLSYRAQLNQWRFHYLDNVVTPGELPISLSAIRSQQFRWNKGGAENFRKMIGRVLSSKNTSFALKFNSFFHLLNSSMFLNVLVAAILSVPLLFIKTYYPSMRFIFNLSSLFILSTLIFFINYWFIHKRLFGGGFSSFFKYIKRFLLFYSLVMGFSAHNSIAVLEGYLGKKSPFVRTPKFNINNLSNKVFTNKYSLKNSSIYTFIEIFFALYFLFGMLSAFWVSAEGDFGLFPFHLLLFVGFSNIVYNGLKQTT